MTIQEAKSLTEGDLLRGDPEHVNANSHPEYFTDGYKFVQLLTRLHEDGSVSHVIQAEKPKEIPNTYSNRVHWKVSDFEIVNKYTITIAKNYKI